MPRGSERAYRWAAAQIGRDARVVRSRPLKGGIASTVHDLTIERAGARTHVVLRRYQEPSPGNAEAIRREAAVLQMLDAHEISAPELIAFDAEGSDAGVSALLMTKLPGRVWLTPPDPDEWIRGLARQLCRIHALPPYGPPFERWWDDRVVEPPPWTDRPDAWRAAIEVYLSRLEPADPFFMHSDYQHFNLLWHRGSISGVLDWVWSWNGPCEIDVGHCALNLAVLFSAGWADRFRLAYEAESGRRCDPRWEIASLMSYVVNPEWPRFIPKQVAGRAPVDVEGMNARVDELLEATLRRL